MSNAAGAYFMGCLATAIFLFLLITVVLWVAWQQVAVEAFNAPNLTFVQVLLATVALFIVGRFFGKAQVR